MKRIASVFLVGIIICGCAWSGYAKGSPDKIIITGDQATTVEITDRETLKKFDPWGGQFIDWTKGAVAAPPDQTRCYKVSFYMKWPGRHSAYDRGELKLIYTVRYVPGGVDAPGRIYLPAEGEDFYRNNIGTIIRERDDGKWHQASVEWDAVIKARIGHQPSFSATLWSAVLCALETCWLLGE